MQQEVKLRNPESTGLEVAIVVPTLNEEQSIGNVLDSISGAMVGKSSRVVVVDGRSTDRTQEIAKSKGAIVLEQRGRGYGDALLTGFEYAAKYLSPQYMVMLDADGTYEANDINKVLAPILEDKADMVLGNRFADLRPGSMSLTNRIGNSLISWSVRNIWGIKVSDTQCGLRAFSLDLFQYFDARAEGMNFATEMLINSKEVGGRISEVPITYNRRVGSAKMRPLKDGTRILTVILRLFRDYKPLTFFGLLGLVSLGLSTVLGLSVVQEWLANGVIHDIARAVLSALLGIVGIQLLSLALLADMMAGNVRRGRGLPRIRGPKDQSE
jgi:dolichol-phosphate hexosyltransferase